MHLYISTVCECVHIYTPCGAQVYALPQRHKSATNESVFPATNWKGVDITCESSVVRAACDAYVHTYIHTYIHTWRKSMFQHTHVVATKSLTWCLCSLHSAWLCQNTGKEHSWGVPRSYYRPLWRQLHLQCYQSLDVSCSHSVCIWAANQEQKRWIDYPQ